MSSVGWGNTTGANGGQCASVTTKSNPTGVPTSGANQAYNQAFKFNTTFAKEWHTYKIIWTQTGITWMVDKTLLLSIDYAIWLPQTLRFILRTNTAPCVDGVTQAGACSAVTGSCTPMVGGKCTSSPAPTLSTAKPNGTVWVKEIRWTPIGASATVAADARAQGSIGDLCKVDGCANPYQENAPGAVSVPKATTRASNKQRRSRLCTS